VRSEAFREAPPGLRGTALESGARTRGGKMLYYAVVFLIIALVAEALGFFGIAGLAGSIAHVLFVIFIVLFLVSLISGLRTRSRL
jgi:uncharacterized membrane protein YtjA (UPF0391 family)